MKRLSFWDYIAWGSLIGIGMWILLKIFGVISTPLWLEYAPLFGAVYIAGWAMNKLDRATDDIRNVKSEVEEIEKDLNKIRIKCPMLTKV